MRTRVSPDALRERNLRFAEEAQGFVEELVRNGPEDGAEKRDTVRLKAAMFVLSSAGLGPVQRHKEEPRAPQSIAEVMSELKKLLAEASDEERAELLGDILRPVNEIGPGDAAP